jgi:hypothetical protein
MIEANGTMLPLWEDVMPNLPQHEVDAVGARIGVAMKSGD